MTDSPAFSGIADHSLVRLLTFHGKGREPGNVPSSAVRTGLQPLDGKLTGFAGMSDTPGLVVQTAADTFAPRTIVGTTGEVAVAAGDGVSGNPTISLPSSLVLAGKTIDVLTSFASYTPTFTGFGTVSGAETYWRRVRDICELDCRFVCGTPTATEARMSLPPGLTSLSGITTHIAGFGFISAASASVWTIISEPNVSYITFGLQNSGSAGLTKQNGNSLLSSGNVLSFRASVRISGW